VKKRYLGFPFFFIQKAFGSHHAFFTIPIQKSLDGLQAFSMIFNQENA
jgi:hypothetical protein